jgi:hypothetical protein
VRLANESVDVGAALMLKLEPDAGVGDSTARAPLIREDQWPDLYAKPSIMFAIASALSIATGDWADATHFADRALKISGATSDGDEKEISLEIRYLVALAKRFHIGDIGPATTETAGNRIIGLHREALELNSQCLSMQSREGGQTTLRELRSYSERAALRLFYVAAFNPKIVRLAMSGTQAESAPPRGLRGPDAEYELDRAEDDLRVCFAIDQIEVPSEDTPRTSFKKRLRRQIYTNAVASYLLRKLWGFEVPNESLFSPKNIVAMKRARDETLHNRGANVMTAEILAFRALAGDDSARRDLKGLQLPRERVLRLDSHVVAALKILVSDWSFTRIS